MNWITRIFLIAALCLLWVLGAMVSREARRTPSESFAALQKELDDGRYDRDLMLGKLDLVVREAERGGANDVVADACLARGKVLMELGACDRARTDLERVLETRPDDRALEQLMIELELKAGDFQRGLTRVHAVLERDPKYGPGWVSLGKLHRVAAESALQSSTQKIQRSLIADDAKKANEWVQRMAAMDPSDPRRVALGHDLRKLFGVADEELCEETTRAADTASEELRQARIALARSLSLQFDVGAFATLLDLYKDAGQIDRALDVGFAALHIPAARQDPKIATFLIRNLLDRNRTKAASDIATWWINRKQALPAEFFLNCCEAFYRDHAWSSLYIAADEVRRVGNATQADHALFYLGAAFCGQGDYPPVRMTLQLYINAASPQVFPGALATAWRMRAVAAEKQKTPAPDLEREALEGSLALDGEQSGEMWLRLAELQLASPHGGYRLPEFRWAKGMSLLPARTEELTPKWIEIGTEEIKSIGMDLDRVRAEFAQGKTWEATSSSGPYEVYELGRIHLEARDFGRARHYARRLLELLPNFVPALNLWLDVEEADGFQRGWLEAFLARLEIVGPDARNAKILRDIAIANLDPRQIQRMMRADPEHFGRRMIARGLAKLGLPLEALTELELVGQEYISDDERILGARLWLDLGDSARALALVLPLRPRLAELETAVPPMLDALLASGNTAEVEAITAELASTDRPERERWLQWSDRLLAQGAAAAAEHLLTRLDGEARLRGGDVLTRLAHAALIRGDGAQAQGLLDRVHAFESGGQAEWIQLLECASAGRWDELAQVALALHAKLSDSNPRADALLNLLARRYGLARTQIAAALESAPYDPQWNLVAAAADTLEGLEPRTLSVFGSHATEGAASFFNSSAEPSDPRRQVCVLLALEEPTTLGWAAKELDLLVRRDPHSLWGVFLQGVAARARNDRAAMRSAFERVTTDHPDFPPGWDGMQELLPQGKRAVADWIDLRLRRSLALGNTSGTPADVLFDRSLDQLRQGKLRVALRDATSAAALDETSGIFQWQIGRICAQIGELGGAIQAYSKACQLLPHVAGLDSTGEFLAVLEEAGKPTPPVISLTDRTRELEALSALIPEDPRIVVALAGVDLAQDARNPTLAVARAYQRLDAFRTRHSATPLELLARGSTAAWAEFLVRLDPGRAESFLSRELELEPDLLAAWLYSARVHVARDEPVAAASDFRVVERLAHDPAVLRESLRVRLSGAITQEELDDYVARILAAENRATPDPDLDLIRAQCYLRWGGASVAQAIAILEPLRGRPNVDAGFAQQFGLLYACALNARGTPEDLAKVEPLLAETATWLSDPYDQNLAQILIGLACHPTVQVSN